MEWNGLPIVVFGSGGISKETYFIIQEINNYNNFQVFNFLGFVEDDYSKVGNDVIHGYKVITSDREFSGLAEAYPKLGVVIPIGNPKVKSIIYNEIKKISNIVFPNIIHPNVTFDRRSVTLGYGNVITSGANLTCNISIGNFNLVNLNTTVGHDTIIGDFNVFNPLVAISGDIKIKDLCLIGTGAKVLQQLTINQGATIGAGAVVVKDVEEFSTVVGIPAKRIK